MAKQPEMRDRFRIFAETSSEAMGPLLAQLTRMGLENIGYELVTDVHRFAQNGERKVHNTTGDEFAKTYIADHPTFRARDLIQYFRDADRTEGSGYTSIRNFVKKKIIKKLSPGNYQRSDVKAISPPSAPAKKTRGSAIRYDTPNDGLILKFIKRRKHVTVVEAGAMLKEEGRNAHSASPIISRFAKAGLLKQTEPGSYDVVQSRIGKRFPPKDEARKEKDRLRQQARRDAAKAQLNGAQGSNAHG